MKNIFITILLGLSIFQLQAQTIDEALNSGDVNLVNQVQDEYNGDLQAQINTLKLEINFLKQAISELNVMPEKSENLLRFESYLNENKDYLYIYKKFNKNDLKAIAKEVGASTIGTKKIIALSIQNKIK